MIGEIAMKRTLAIVTVWLMLAALTSPVRAFDCSKAYLPVDFVICSAPDVLSANEGHERAWFVTRARLDETQQKALLDDQRRWMRQFPTECGIPAKGKSPTVISKEAQQCVTMAILRRTDFLQHYHEAVEQRQPGSAQTSTFGATTPSANEDPDSALSYLMRGLSRFHEKSDLDGAISDFSKAIQLSPPSAPERPDTTKRDALKARSEVWEKKGDVDASISDLRDALKQQFGLSSSYYQAMIRLLEKKGGPRLALTFASETIGQHQTGSIPSYWWEHLYRGDLYRKLSQPQLAIADYDTALKKLTSLHNSDLARYEAQIKDAITALGGTPTVVAAAPRGSDPTYPSAEGSPNGVLGRSKVDITCGRQEGQMLNMEIEVRIQLSDRQYFADSGFVTGLIGDLTNRMRAKCASQREDFYGGLRVAIPGDEGAGALGYLSASKNGGQPWTVTGNGFVNALRREQEREQAQVQAQQAATARKSLRAYFASQNQVQAWPGSATVVANPFAYKGQVVAFPARFDRMLSENEALFSGELIVTGVPTTQFRGGENLILAVMDRGIRTVKGAMGEASVPDLQYMGVYVCKLGGCADFWD